MRRSVGRRAQGFIERLGQEVSGDRSSFIFKLHRQKMKIEGGDMLSAKASVNWRLWRLASLLIWTAVLLDAPKTSSAQNQVMGELEFEGKTKLERDSGVWVDGNYVGYLKELKGKKKVLLLPGQHEVIVRQSGYLDDVQKIVVQPGEQRLVVVSLKLAPTATVPNITATLKLNIKPNRAAVFLDEKYVGHSGELEGHSVR